jgi:hypothetical protein
MRRELPGLNSRRLLALISAAIDRCELNLTGYSIFTEAASGAYVVTPVMAAMAGADRVQAITRATRHGSVEEISSATLALAKLAGVADRIEIVTQKTKAAIAQADIVTNSGHVRPLDAEVVSWMKPSAVIPLMYESWELRDGDVDVEACRKKGIRITGTHERHQAVDVFSFLGPMAVKLLFDAGVSVYTSRVLFLCDNDFGPFIERGLKACGANVDWVKKAGDAPADARYDAVLVSRTPTANQALSTDELALIAKRWPGAVVTVYWGDVERASVRDAGLTTWPEEAPHAGHMGILPSGVGPEPIVRLQSGSLKAAEALLRYGSQTSHPAHAFGQPL